MQKQKELTTEKIHKDLKTEAKTEWQHYTNNS